MASPGMIDPTAKPLWGAPFDFQHYLARGLTEYWLFNEGTGPTAIGIVGGNAIPLGSNVQWSAQGVGSTPGTAGGASFPIASPNQNGLTIFCTAYVTGGSVLPNGRIFKICNVSLSVNYGGTVNGIGLMIEGGTWTYSGINAVVGSPVFVAVTTSGNTYTFYINGVQVFQNAFGHPTTTPNGSLPFYDSAATPSNGLYSAGFYANRILSPSEIADLATTQYQMFLGSSVKRFSAAGNVVAPPIAVTSLFAAAGNATITLNWLDGQGNNVGQFYKVLRRVTGTPPYVQVGTSPNGFTAYVDNTVTNGTSYEYVVIASNTGGDSPQSTASNPVTPSGGGGGAQGVYSGVHGTPVFTTGHTYHQG